MLRWKRERGVKKKLLNHLSEAKKERNYYNSNTKLAKEQREIVEKNYLLKQGKVEYRSVDAVSHLSWDWAQDVRKNHDPQQPSQIFFQTRGKINIFGVQNEATGIQINYLTDESEFLNKGVNGTLSLAFDAIKKFNLGEKHLIINCDNAVGQNKNKFVLWFCAYLLICDFFNDIKLHFLIAGHTKFHPDGKFGMIKKRYRRKIVEKIDDFVKVVAESSPQGLNQTQRYENGQGFQYFDFKVLGEHFKNLSNIRNYHHFHFYKSNPGVVGVQESADSPVIKINLWKDLTKAWESIKEIKKLMLPIIPLPKEKQGYVEKEFSQLELAEK